MVYEDRRETEDKRESFSLLERLAFVGWFVGPVLIAGGAICYENFKEYSSLAIETGLIVSLSSGYILFRKIF